MKLRFTSTMATALAGFIAMAPMLPTLADDKAMIDTNTKRALTWLRTSGDDTADLLERAAGVLVFPDVVKMGFGVGGQFGEGSLLVDGETVGYYATAGKNFGMGAEADYKAEVILFMTDEALQSFRETRSWKVGEHAVVPVATGTSDSIKVSGPAGPMVGLIFSEDGLVSDLGLDGSRITRIAR